MKMLGFIHSCVTYHRVHATFSSKDSDTTPVLTLAELHDLVLTSFIKLIKLLQNLMKLLPNHIMVK